MPLESPDRRYQQLAKKWLDGSITEAEKQEFAQWYNHGQDAPLEIPENVAASEEEHRARLLSNIDSSIRKPQRIYPISAFRSLMAAAVILFVLAAGGYFLLKRNNSGLTNAPAPIAAADIAPGGDKATLTLGDGSVIELHALSDGSIGGEKGLKARKQQGELIYEKNTDQDSKISYHTITTPRGGQFRVVLPDGSKVWLNASSSLQYPTNFNGDTRKVRLSGEGYFEVAKSRSANKNRSFLINVSDREQVEVLGTHFNIMAYSDERVIKTTLLEGSVRVSKNGTPHTRLLRPGQQAVSSGNKGFEVRSGTDLAESISWKNGQISFKDADIRSIMRQVARWYDVDIRYEGEMPERLFNGGISRSSNLSSVLKVLELNDIHFKVENKTITVIP